MHYTIDLNKLILHVLPMSNQKEWKTTKIPKKLFDEIKKLVEAKSYPSVASFVADSIREKIEKLERHEIDKKKYPPFRNSPQSDREDHLPD